MDLFTISVYQFILETISNVNMVIYISACNNLKYIYITYARAYYILYYYSMINNSYLITYYGTLQDITCTNEDLDGRIKIIMSPICRIIKCTCHVQSFTEGVSILY